MQRQQAVWGNPIPAAFCIIAVANVMLFGFLTGLAPQVSWPFDAALLIGAGIGVAVCGIIQYRRGDEIYASWFLVFALFVVAAAAEVTMQFMGVPHQLMGWAFMMFSAIFFLLAFPMGRESWLTFVSLILCALATALLSVMGFTCATPESPIPIASGWLFFIFGWLLLYQMVSMLLEIAYTRPLLPIGRPLFK
jgi:hypothetical protein